MDSVIVHLSQGDSELQAKYNLISVLNLTPVPLVSSNAVTEARLGGNGEAGENSGLHPSVC